MTMPIQTAIHGATGRNGRRLIALIANDPSLKLVAAIARRSSKHLGEDSGVLAGVSNAGVPIASEFPKAMDVVIDFSSPEGSQHALEHCVLNSVPIVIASTGLTPEQIDRIAFASKQIPICYAPNMSVAVNLTMKLVEQAARSLRDVAGGADVEIIERHHRYKEDSPSGTALKFGQIVAREMGLTNHAHGRVGQVGARPHDQIGYHAVRVGDDAGQHTIVFGMLGETIELRVAASNRDCYASGAIAAAKFLIGKPPGQYSMFDVLGF
jgi:4-hydroxy-tetrahydrodipicolinate reductase